MTVQASPIPFDSSQEMSKKMLELRYQLDAPMPYVGLHAHSFYEIYYFVEGPLECYTVGTKRYYLCPGDILLIPPDVSHSPSFSQNPKPYRRYVLWISVEQLEQMERLDDNLLDVLRLCQQRETYRIRCTTPSVRQSVEGHLNAMWQEELSVFSCRNACVYGMCLNFLGLLNRVLANENAFYSVQSHDDILLDRVLTYIHSHFSEGISLNAVAEYSYTSSSNIELLFAKKMGKPFYRYVTECRISHAQTLIADGMLLKDVGAACGYNDYSNFYRAFLQEVGISPSQYRQNISINASQAKIS